MNVFSYADKKPLSLGRPIVTVGSFDGVHLGHRALLDAVKNRVHLNVECGATDMVVTFADHPRHVLRGAADFGLLTTLDEKLSLLDMAGVQNVAVIPFDSEIAAMSPREFVKRVLIDWLGMGWLVVGHDHRFGRGQEGDYKFLTGLSRELGFGLDRVEEFCVKFYRPDRIHAEDIDVSSSIIRSLIARGDMRWASWLLGSDYIIKADIVGGNVIPSCTIPPEYGLCLPLATCKPDAIPSESGLCPEVVTLPGGGFILSQSGKLLPPAGDYHVYIIYAKVHDKDTTAHINHHDTLHIDPRGNMRLESTIKDIENITIKFVYDREPGTDKGAL